MDIYVHGFEFISIDINTALLKLAKSRHHRNQRSKYEDRGLRYERCTNVHNLEHAKETRYS